MKKKIIILQKNNFLKLVEETKLLIIDHHILRDIKAIAFTESLKDRAKEFKNQVGTFAEFQGKNNQLLEAKRMKLYLEGRPSEEFMHWANLPAEIRRKSVPPL